MYILVNVDRHKNVMGEIVSNLVSSYGVPVSIVDNIQKICPKCSAEKSRDEENAAKNEELVEAISSTKSSASTSSNCSSSTSKIARLVESIEREEPPKKQPKIEIKEVKLEEDEDESAQFPDTQTIFENAIANAFQNSSKPDFSLGTNKSLPVSDDGISNSSNLEIDDDDYTNNVCINPELLATFISQTPNLFANASGEMAKLTRLPAPSTSNAANAKREIPNLTVNGKTRRGRIVYTQYELNILEKYYLDDPNACADLNKRKEMCSLLEIDYHRLKVWFQNRRRKDKIRSQEELISSPNGEEDMMTEMVEKMVNEGIKNCSS